MAKEYTFTARIDDGRLKIGLRTLTLLREAVRDWRSCPVTVTIERQHATRSLDQNALYWVGYVTPLADYCGVSPKWMHAYLKKKFLPKQRIEIVDKRTGVIVDEVDLEALSTTTLTKIEFSDYLGEIKDFAATVNVRVGTSEAA